MKDVELKDDVLSSNDEDSSDCDPRETDSDDSLNQPDKKVLTKKQSSKEGKKSVYTLSQKEYETSDKKAQKPDLTQFTLVAVEEEAA